MIVVVGTVTQYSLMPLAAFAIANAFDLDPQIAVGLILTASAPGAMSSSVVSYVAKADLAYSVSLTTVSTLLAPVATPGLTWLLARSELEVPVLNMLVEVLLLVIVPLLAGFVVRHFFAKKVERISAVFPAISVTFIVLICSRTIAANRESPARNQRDAPGDWRPDERPGAGRGLPRGLGLPDGWSPKAVPGHRRGDAERRAGRGPGHREHFSDRAAMPAAAFVFICIITASIMAAIWQRMPAEAAGSRSRINARY